MTDNYSNTAELEETRRKCEFVNQEPLCVGNWLSLNKTTYQDPTGKERAWETVERTTRDKNCTIDAVCMISILKRLLHYDCMVLVKQYRPAMKCYTLEFPAGLVEGNETLEDTAKRELKEETGYSGNVLHIGPASALDPGVSNCTMVQVSMHIDGDDPTNKNPSLKTDEGEFIEVLLVPVHELLKKLQALSKEDGIVVDSRVYSYAVGFTQCKQLMHPKKI